ncbi:hypothetical protein Scep_016692 [Stephania cephalantha]|uniref:Uncharacterized protein n=1 Tax=Stephania cephalantha TaxID=152367 RepID=A0AAP0NUE5_9MAGN
MPWEPPLERLNGVMELPRSLLSSPLPSDPSAAPYEGRGGTPHIPYFRWDPSIDEAIVRVAYDAKLCVRYGTLMHELRALGVRPDFVTNEAWNRYRDYRASADFRARSEKASHNRKNEKGDPGTGPLKHTDGTWSFRTYEDILALDKDEDDEVTPNDVFLHVHTKDHDGAKLVKRQFDSNVQRLAQFEAFMQSQLGRRMDFGANTSQAPPPPPPQEHHQQVGMDPLVHHSSSTTMTIETTQIGWMRSTLVTKVSTPKESFEGVQGVGEGQLQVLFLRRTVLEQIAN